MTGQLGVRHAAIGVSDLPRALAFYTETLGFDPAYVTSPDWAMVTMAGTSLSLIPVPDYTPPRTHGGAHPAHLGIVMGSAAEVDTMHQRLQFTDVPSIEPPKAHRDGSYGFYLTDPDGNHLECIFIPYRLQGSAHPGPVAEAVVLLVPDGTDPYTSLLERMRRHAPDVPAALASTDAASVVAVVRQLTAQGGIRRIRLVPVALAPAGPDLPALVDAVRQAWPDLSVVVAPALRDDPQVQEAMVSAIVDMLETRH